MTLTQITEHSLTKTNSGSINFDGEGRSGSPTMPNHRVVKIPTIGLKFPPSPRDAERSGANPLGLPISSSLFFQNETALPDPWG